VRVYACGLPRGVHCAPPVQFSDTPMPRTNDLNQRGKQGQDTQGVHGLHNSEPNCEEVQFILRQGSCAALGSTAVHVQLPCGEAHKGRQPKQPQLTMAKRVSRQTSELGDEGTRWWCCVPWCHTRAYGWSPETHSTRSSPPAGCREVAPPGGDGAHPKPPLNVCTPQGARSTWYSHQDPTHKMDTSFPRLIKPTHIHTDGKKSRRTELRTPPTALSGFL
jgi:hypothetical protein